MGGEARAARGTGTGESATGGDLAGRPGILARDDESDAEGDADAGSLPIMTAVAFLDSRSSRMACSSFFCPSISR